MLNIDNDGVRNNDYKDQPTNSTVLYDIKGQFCGKWNAGDEEGAHVFIETSPSGKFLSKQVFSQPTYPNFSAQRKYHFVNNINGDTLAGFYTNYDATTWIKELVRIFDQDVYFDKQIPMQELHAPQHGHAGEISPPSSDLCLRQNVQAFGSHGRLESKLTDPADFFHDPFIDHILKHGTREWSENKLSGNPLEWNDNYLPDLGPRDHIVKAGDTLTSIIKDYELSAFDAWKMKNHNNISAHDTRLKIGQRLIIPPSNACQDQANQFRSASAMNSLLMGSFLPHMITPHRKRHTNWLKVVIVVAIIVAIAIAAPHLAPALYNAVMGAGAWATAGTAGMITAYTAAGIIADIGIQGVEMAAGMQNGFNVSELTVAAITAGFDGYLNASAINAVRAAEASGKTLEAASMVEKMTHVAESVVLRQLSELALGQRSKFDFTAAGIDIAVAYANQKVSDKLDADTYAANPKATSGDLVANHMTAAAVSTAMAAVLGSAVKHQPLNVANTAANAIGAAIGTGIGSTFADQLDAHYQQAEKGVQYTKQARRHAASMRTPTAAEQHAPGVRPVAKPKPAARAYNPYNDPEILKAEAVANMSVPSASLLNPAVIGKQQAIYNASAAQHQNWQVDHSFGAGFDRAKQEVISRQSKLIFGEPLPNGLTELQVASQMLPNFVESLNNQPLNPVTIMQERYDTAKQFINTMISGSAEEKGYAVGMGLYEGGKGALLNLEPAAKLGSLALGKFGLFAGAKLAGAGKVFGLMGSMKTLENSALKKYILTNISESRAGRTRLNVENFALYDAKEAQIIAGYNADTWAITNLIQGDLVYGGLPGQTAYYTSKNTIVNADYNATKLFQSLQVKPDPVRGYRQKIGAYEVVKDMSVPSGLTIANPHLGIGGGDQFLIKNFSQNLKLISTIELGEGYEFMPSSRPGR